MRVFYGKRSQQNSDAEAPDQIFNLPGLFAVRLQFASTVALLHQARILVQRRQIAWNYVEGMWPTYRTQGSYSIGRIGTSIHFTVISDLLGFLAG